MVIIAVFLLVVAAVLVVIAINPGDSPKKAACVDVAVDGADRDISPDEALSDFLADRPDEEVLPLTGWTASTVTSDSTVFTSAVNGQWTVTVSRGQVRHYSGCPA
jgi:hypothetical protein